MEVFDRGDIVRVGLDPVAGHEMRGASRPALVLTTKDFNRLGDVWRSRNSPQRYS